MAEAEQSACDWFQEAARWYMDKHQGCPWCGGANVVYKSERGPVIEFLCGSCEFFARHDQENSGYFMAPGHARQGRPTMHAV